MSIKSTKLINSKNSKKNVISMNDFPTLGVYKPIEKTTMNYKEKLEMINKIDSIKDELPEGWIRLSTYKPPPKKEIEYPDMTPAEEFIKMMDLVSKNRERFYESRMIDPPEINIPPPEYEDIEESDSNESDLDMEDPEYEKIMNKFEKNK